AAADRAEQRPFGSIKKEKDSGKPAPLSLGESGASASCGGYLSDHGSDGLIRSVAHATPQGALDHNSLDPIETELVPPAIARTVVAILKPEGQFGVVNWHRRPREETLVFGQPRGPRTEMRMEPRDVAVIVEPAGLLLNRTVEFPPYHYRAMFR